MQTAKTLNFVPVSPEQSCLVLFVSYTKSQVFPCPTANANVLCRERCHNSLHILGPLKGQAAQQRQEQELCRCRALL